MTFVTVTKLFGAEVCVNHESIEQAAQWAEFHNLVYVERELAPGEPCFRCFAADHAPLNAAALQRLAQCVYRDTDALYQRRA